MNRFITSESVAEGHPDKICDQIADSILDHILAQDRDARAAVNCLVTGGIIFIGGEITAKAQFNASDIVKATLEKIGYNSPGFGMNHQSVGIISSVRKQSSDIGRGVDKKGAGDQGAMYGYACNETPELMPLPISLSHSLVRALAHARRSGAIDGIGPDGKSQVTVEYENSKPKRVDCIVIAQQHLERVKTEHLRLEIMDKVIVPVCGKWMDANTKIFINSTGRFVKGGPEADSGFSGKKIIIDTYGGIGRHGGGSFSGKDPTKVDRSAAYAARYIAKNIVASGVAEKCEVQLSYAIGIAQPTSLDIDCFGTSKVDESVLKKFVYEKFPIRPADIISRLKLKRPIYSKTAVYGHFGRSDRDFTWEKTDFALSLAKLIKR